MDYQSSGDADPQQLGAELEALSDAGAYTDPNAAKRKRLRRRMKRTARQTFAALLCIPVVLILVLAMVLLLAGPSPLIVFVLVPLFIYLVLALWARSQPMPAAWTALILFFASKATSLYMVGRVSIGIGDFVIIALLAAIVFAHQHHAAAREYAALQRSDDNAQW